MSLVAFNLHLNARYNIRTNFYWQSNRLKNGGQYTEFKGALSGLRQFLATESPFEMLKNAFYSTLKALFVLTTFKLLSLLFVRV